MPGGTFRKSPTSKTVTLQESGLHRDRKKQILASPHGCPWSLVRCGFAWETGGTTTAKADINRGLEAGLGTTQQRTNVQGPRTKDQGPRTTDNCPIGVKPYAEDPG